jgi:GNAT superfamily N-acetyltransferase
VNTYTLIHTPPSVEAYMHLREADGVHMRDATDTIAMGRIIGDGGCFFQVVDIAVLPAYQGQGLGTQIMAALMQTAS